ncbi:MAG: DNA repair protein RadC [Desulfobulbaceae bacterium]|nr:DNA repair protein RadC [Desulfobulbaceae bacterium]HIJ78419.1 DNA repair protein RadC [Deltaproteobacteria bacterium]
MNKSDWQIKGQGHRQRLRDKFLAHGLAGFADAEVLEMLLAMGTPRKDCKETARAALDRFGSLAAALDAAPVELQQIKGLGEKNTFALSFVQAVARRYLKERLKDKEYLRSSREVGDYLVHAMRGLKREVLMAVLLDSSLAIIDTRVVAEGTLARNTIHPRELIKVALAGHAASLIIAHNHPSGSLTPSEEDKKLTRHLFVALAYAEVQLLDHLIIGGSERPFSFADNGLMEQIRRDCLPLAAGG